MSKQLQLRGQWLSIGNFTQMVLGPPCVLVVGPLHLRYHLHFQNTPPILGCPEVRDGSLYANDRPGLGVDMDEKLAAQYLCTDEVIGWTQTRLPDGSPTRPSLQRMNT
jgi:hypothetical protein